MPSLKDFLDFVTGSAHSERYKAGANEREMDRMSAIEVAAGHA